MSEIYSATERAIILTIIFAFSFIVSFIYLYRRVDYKRISLIIFIPCWIYFSLFISLNIIGIYDFVYAGRKGFDKFSKFISGFYAVFNWVDIILGFVIFTGLIYYFESGYYKTIAKVFELLIIIWNKIRKWSKCKIIVIICVGVPIIGGVIAIVIIFRDRFGYSNPLDYIRVLINIYGMFKIYNSVGFFMIQIIVDCKRQKNAKLIRRYYRYSIIKITEKTESYIEKMKHCFEILKQEVQKLDKNISSGYNDYLEKTIQQIKEKIDILELQGNGINENNILNLIFNAGSL